MSTKTGIYNVALGYAKQGATVVSFDEDTVAARRCDRFYDAERRAHLQMFPWSFAKKVQYLSIKTGVDSVAGYENVYSYPAQTLNLNAVGDLIIDGNLVDKKTAYQKFIGDDLNSSEIHTNFSQALCDITVDVINENIFPQLFSNLISYAMALSLGPLYGLKQSELDNIERKYMVLKVTAETASAKEENIPFDVENEYVEVRGS